MSQAEKQQVTFCYISSDFHSFVTKDCEVVFNITIYRPNSAKLKKMSFKTRIVQLLNKQIM